MSYPWNLFYDIREPLPPPPTTWASGVYANHSATKVTNFEVWRGLECSHHSVFPSRASWAALLNNWWVVRARPGQRFDVSVPLWPEDGNVSTTYTSQWTSFAGMLQAGDVVRLGWECNLPGWPHAITSANRTAWVARFKAAYSAIKTANSGILIELCLNEGPSQTSVSNTQIVGDLAGYFDILGLDFYWWWGVTDTDTAWNAQINRDGGLNWHLTQAQTLGVKLAVSEWGIASVADHGTGDSAFFVGKMMAWFAAHANDIHHECYFNEDSNPTGSFIIYPTTTNPVASAQYLSGIGTYLK